MGNTGLREGTSNPYNDEERYDKEEDDDDIFKQLENLKRDKARLNDEIKELNKELEEAAENDNFAQVKMTLAMKKNKEAVLERLMQQMLQLQTLADSIRESTRTRETLNALQSGTKVLKEQTGNAKEGEDVQEMMEQMREVWAKAEEQASAVGSDRTAQLFQDDDAQKYMDKYKAKQSGGSGAKVSGSSGGPGSREEKLKRLEEVRREAKERIDELMRKEQQEEQQKKEMEALDEQFQALSPLPSSKERKREAA